MAATDSMLQALNPAQRAAVTSPSSVVQVLAPPGSGKTKTLTARVAYLISHLGKHPGNIIVCTFTVKAAREMKERLTSILGSEITNRLLLGTFHSISRRFLCTYGRHISLNEKFGIADTSDSKSIVTRIVKRLKLTIDPKTARNRISTLKSKGVTAEQYAEQTASKSRSKGMAEAIISTQDIVSVYSEYEKHLRTSNLLDYDDLLVKCGELLQEFPACVEHIQAVLIDEFQDTNHIQFDLMQRFSSARKVVTTVGDPDQSIYGWRSADVTNLKKMKEHFPDLHTVNLEENYRSSGAILLAAQEIIEQDQSRPAKSLMPTHALGMSPVIRKLPYASKEAGWLVSELRRTTALTAGLLKWDDYAILLRSASLSRLIESALGKAGIPYRMVGGHRFFDRYEVKLVLDYLRVIDLTDHSDAMARILNVPARQIGDGTLKVLLDESANRQATLWTVVKGLAQGNMKLPLKERTLEDGKTKKYEQVSKQAQKGLEAFFNTIHTARVKLQEPSRDSLPQFIEWVIKKLGLHQHLKNKYPDELATRWANVEELVANAGETVTKQYEDDKIMFSHEIEEGEGAATLHSRADDLRKFLGNVALSTELQEKGNGSTSGNVTISTIHAAKGLEWPIVFIPAVYVGSIPHSRAEDHDEERRLLYVAMTRAQSMLYLSYPNKDSQSGETTLSSFLTSKTISRHFSTAGPSIKTQDVQEMSLILRRPCPTAKDIAVAQDAAMPREDTKFLKRNYDGNEMEYTDEESADDSRKRGWKGHEGDLPPGKRAAMQGFSTVTTLLHDGQFSTANTTLSTTLIGARARPNPTDLHPLVATEADPTEALPAIARSGKGTKQQPQTNQSIKSFFAPGTAAGAMPTLDSSSPALQNLPSNYQPPQGTVHRTGASKALTSIQDGPSISDPQERSMPCSIVSPQDKEGRVASSTTQAEGRAAASTTTGSGLRPASTFNSTSVTQLGYPTPAVRKTLGARRTFTGWADRKNK